MQQLCKNGDISYFSYYINTELSASVWVWVFVASE